MQEYLHDRTIEDKLGYTQVKEWLKSYCLSRSGMELVDQLAFSNDLEKLLTSLNLVKELKDIIEKDNGFPQSNYLDIEGILHKLKISGAYIESQEFRDLRIFLKTIARIKQYIDFQEPETVIYLSSFMQDFELDFQLVREIDKVIADDGTVKDDASYELFEIRKEIQKETFFLRKETDRLLKLFIKEGYTDPELLPTIRNERIVIPVYAEYKRKVKGFIHDESATGQTTFIEPTQLFDLNNLIKELTYKETREVKRILFQLSELVRVSLVDLFKAGVFLAQIDFTRAKAKLAQSMNAVLPQVVQEPILQCKNARHPLLEKSLKEHHKAIVPLSYALNQDQRILILSGPNAGGKSICLKTAGLLQYMFQTGLLVPVQEGSVFGLFESIFIDIGDQQSIENDLSTYSSHLKNINRFIQYANERSLVLIDEFGGGTEPHAGSAIAESVLRYFHDQKVKGVVTTHFDQLKKLASELSGFVNGAMRYDLESLKPLYILDWNKPGSSFAIEIALNIGLPKHILENAKKIMGIEWQNYNQLLNELELEREQLRLKEEILNQGHLEIVKRSDELDQRKLELDARKINVVNEAKEKARVILNDATQVLKDVQKKKKSEQSISKEEYQQNLTIIQTQYKTLSPDHTFIKKAEVLAEKGAIEAGCYVKIKDNDAFGKVVEVKGKDVEILIGQLKSVVKLDRLIRVSKKDYEFYATKERVVETASNNTSMMIERTQTFNPKLDVRGLRGEEALALVKSWFDDALLLGFQEVMVVHGKGNGILRTLVRDYLSSMKQVRRLEDDHADRGGSGATVIKL